jgi:hypothetical protein
MKVTMLNTIENRKRLNSLFQKIRLQNPSGESTKDKGAKIQQIMAYLEIVHSIIRKYSPKREIVIVDCASGNNYLSFLINTFYSELYPKRLKIHCIDTNESLMENGRQKATELGFENMQFYTGDILDVSIPGKIDLVVSLHACDAATDKALFFGLKHGANTILSVSCCQHSLKKKIRHSSSKSITKHQIFKDRMTYMVGDSLRALLMETEGYKTDLFEFVSSRYTDKNIMLRAKKGGHSKSAEARHEYECLANLFHAQPELEDYIRHNLSFRKSG